MIEELKMRTLSNLEKVKLALYIIDGARDEVIGGPVWNNNVREITPNRIAYDYDNSLECHLIFEDSGVVIDFQNPDSADAVPTEDNSTKFESLDCWVYHAALEIS